MTDANVQAILGDPTPPVNPLSILSGWQGYANQVAQNAQIKAATANMQQQTQNAGQDQTQKRYVWQGQKVLAAASLPIDQQTPDLYKGIIKDGLETGNITPVEANQYMQHIEQANGNPHVLKNNGILFGKSTLDATAQFAANAGQNQSINTGGTTNLIRQPSPSALTANPNAAPVQVGQLQNSISPQYLNTGNLQVPVGGVNNTPVLPSGQLNQTGAAQRVLGPPDASGAPTTVPLGAVTPGYQQPGGAAQPSYGPNNPPRLGQAPSLPGQMTTGLPPGTSGPMEESAKQFSQARQDAGSYATRVFPLLQQEALLKSGTQTGPGTEEANHAKSLLLSMTPESLKKSGIDPIKLAGIDPNKVSDYEQLKKYMAQTVLSNPLASASDARLAQGLAGSPNASLQNLSNRNINRANIALMRMQQAAVMNYDGPPNKFADYQAKYATTVDPRAFAADLMSPAEQKKMIGQMTPKERLQFKNSLDIMDNTPGLSSNTAMPTNR